MWIKTQQRISCMESLWTVGNSFRFSCAHPVISMLCLQTLFAVLFCVTLLINMKSADYCGNEIVLRTIGDGHCLLHAVILSWQHQRPELSPPSLYNLKCDIFVESLKRFDDYICYLSDVNSGEQYIRFLSDYILKKRYNTCFGDLVPSIISNALCVKLKIINVHGNGTDSVVVISPSSNAPSGSLLLHRHNEHYSGIKCMADPSPSQSVHTVSSALASTCQPTPNATVMYIISKWPWSKASLQ